MDGLSTGDRSGTTARHTEPINPSHLDTTVSYIEGLASSFTVIYYVLLCPRQHEPTNRRSSSLFEITCSASSVTLLSKIRQPHLTQPLQVEMADYAFGAHNAAGNQDGTITGPACVDMRGIHLTREAYVQNAAKRGSKRNVYAAKCGHVTTTGMYGRKTRERSNTQERQIVPEE